MARHKQKLSTCPNCDHKLESHYDFCPSCGQENHDIRVPVGHIGYEFVEGITHFDTKVWNTLKSFFTKPGQITKEYLEGKRARYVPPPRMYIFISVIFFIIIAKYGQKVSRLLKENQEKEKIQIVDNGRTYKLDKEQVMLILSGNRKLIDSILISCGNPMAHDTAALRKIFIDSLKIVSERSYLKEKAEDDAEKTELFSYGGSSKDDSDSIKHYNRILEYDSLYQRTKTMDFAYESSVGILGVDWTPNELKEIKNMNSAELDSIIHLKRSQLIAQNKDVEPAWLYKLFMKNFDDIKDFNFDNLFAKSIKSFSFAMFLLMPLIAFITWIFFHSQRKYYVEHLIYSIHIHTVIFIFLSFVLGINLYFPWFVKKNVFIILGIIVVYIILSLRRVFNNSWKWTIAKFIFINIIYLFTLLTAVFGSFVLGGLG